MPSTHLNRFYAVALAVALVVTACNSPVTTRSSGISASVGAVATAAPVVNVASAANPTAAASPAAETAVTAATKLNLNTASDNELLTVPGVGSRMLREFKEYRPYTSITQFRNELGKYVDAATIAGYEQYVYVPIDVNQTDAASLQQLPGVTADLANTLITGRPYASTTAFLDKLSTLVTAEQAQAAAAYMVTP